MKAKAPRGNAGRRISLTNFCDSAPSASPPSNVSPALRKYQREAVEHVLAAHDRGETCGLVSLPTGSGKTIIAGEVLRRLNRRALIVAHTSVLVAQLHEALSTYLDERVGLVLDGVIDDAEARVIVASRQSLTSQRLFAIVQSGAFGTLVFDEAHHASEDSTYRAILDALQAWEPKLFVLGLTATPWREAGRMLFERWWFSREISDLIPLGVLAPVRYQTVELPLALREVRLSGSPESEYRCKALEPRLLDVAQETATHVAPLIGTLRHIVIFAVTVKHAQALAEAFELAGVGAAPIWGAMRPCDRDDILKRWRDAEIRASVNVGIVTEGFDEPRISAIVFARPTASTLFYIQALGRGLRVAPGKLECLVVDCVGLGDLRDARQCTLDSIVPEVAALEGLPPSSPQGRRLVAAPGDDAVRLWHRIAPDAYALALDSRELFFVVRDAKMGLYRASYVADNEIRERFQPAPFAALLSTLRKRLRGRTLVFGNPKASWRCLPPTERQIGALAATEPTWANRAIEESWQRGRRRVGANDGLCSAPSASSWYSERGSRIAWGGASAARPRIPSIGGHARASQSLRPSRRSSGNARGQATPAQEGRKGSRSQRDCSPACRGARGLLTKARNAIATGASKRTSAKRAAVAKRSEAAKKGWATRRTRTKRAAIAAAPNPIADARFARFMPFLAERGVIYVNPVGSDRSLVGEHWDAIRSYLETGRTDALDRFQDKSILDAETERRLAFVTDPAVILEHEAELDFGVTGFYKRREEVTRLAS